MVEGPVADKTEPFQRYFVWASTSQYELTLLYVFEMGQVFSARIYKVLYVCGTCV